MTSELFPTLVRSTGMGICAASGRIGALVAQFVNGALVADHPVRLLLVASGTLLLGAATPCLLPDGGDMTGQPVHDVMDNYTGSGTVTRDNQSRILSPVTAMDVYAKEVESYTTLQVQQSPGTTMRIASSSVPSYKDDPSSIRRSPHLTEGAEVV
eukprot:CAMPEP_0178876330 /NCGR_PEP_ID=MMETSP0747-20121128/10237_1 /TAXON_ID=913974 /ORGANISM="Nitzschia punctata, Strain CCMP561" /LENGTH=154 /DNA_ID=CAMNT_0020543879 /DNA_START=492 /DNA_END=956 /DNA_ORIENTATION=+